MHILLGVGLILLGIWISVFHMYKLTRGDSNYSGGITNLIIVGIALIVCGIVEVCK